MKHPLTRMMTIAAMLMVAGSAGSSSSTGSTLVATGHDGERSYDVKPLPSLGGTSSRGNGINDCPGTNICDLGTLDPGGTAEAWGVNQRGQVVGSACPPSGPCRAFIWEDGEMKDLNRFKGDYPHHLENAMDINDAGRVVGRARVGTQFEAFSASPKRWR